MEFLNIKKKKKHIWIASIDCPDSSVNKLSSKIFDEIESLINNIEKDSSIKGLVVTSAKKDNFMAGADLDELLDMKTSKQVKDYIQQGNTILSRLAAWDKPVVCAIHGSCLGGGLEFALACDYRIASEDRKTVFALPEVKLGLFPAGGGTQRLPRLIGLAQALPLILTGKQLRAKKAKKLGIIDEVVNPFVLEDAAVKKALLLAGNKKKKQKVKRPLINRVLEKYKMGRNFIFTQAKKGVMKQTKGLYPAPLAIIDSIQYGFENGLEQGIKKDIQRFEKLVLSSEAQGLINLFFAMNSTGKGRATGDVKSVKKLGVLGAGLMGHGIAGVSVDIVDTVLLKDINLNAASKGINEVKKGLSLRKKSGGITHFEKHSLGAKLIPCDDYSLFAGTNLVIEAVFEDLGLKQTILKDIENATDGNTIFASNTSSIPISQIARKSKRPENVIGMHYFSPVRSMPLLEIITTDKTAPWVIQTALDFGIKQGKTCIVVKDSPAFYTTRILTFMLNEAMLLVQEGVDVRTIDDAMTGFGYPVGPITLADEVGFDVGVHVIEEVKVFFKDRNIQSSSTLQTLYDKGFSGRKNKKGFYEYKGQRKKGKKVANREVNEILGIKTKKNIDIEQLVQRVSLTMVNEAIHCLEEGIINSPKDGDLGAVLGLGFPPFRGGPFRYVDSQGPDKILKIMEKLEDKFGDRFKPARLLKQIVRDNSLFYK